MADNIPITAGSGTTVSTEEVTTLNGGAVSAQHIQRVANALRTADGVAIDLPGDSTNGLDVDVTRVKPDGTNVMPSLDAAARRGYVQLTDGTNALALSTAFADAQSNSQVALTAEDFMMVFNGSTWDRLRGMVNTNKTAQYTTAQTGAALWTPAAGKAVVITALQIQVGGTTAGNVQVWFGGSADTAYTRGTDFPIFDGEFAPSATNKPGVYVAFPTHIRGTADFVLRVTTSAAINPITVSVWGYEV